MKTYYLVIDADCQPSIHPVERELETNSQVVAPQQPQTLQEFSTVAPFVPMTPFPMPTPLPAPIPAPAPYQTHVRATATVRTDGSNLNLREGPSLEAEVIARIPNGTRIIVLDAHAANGWMRVSHNGMQGYVASQWVRLD